MPFDRMIWVGKHPLARLEMLGYLPDMVSESDPRSAREQFDANYRQGGGWCPMQGFTLTTSGALTYPGDPPMRLMFETTLHGKETIRVYEHDWVVIIQLDGTYEIARMD